METFYFEVTDTFGDANYCWVGITKLKPNRFTPHSSGCLGSLGSTSALTVQDTTLLRLVYVLFYLTMTNQLTSTTLKQFRRLKCNKKQYLNLGLK